MKRKIYEKPSVEVVVLKQQPLMQTVSATVSASMDGTFTETDLARESVFNDDDLFLEDE